MSKDRSLRAVFVEDNLSGQYSLTVNVIGRGTVIKSPDKDIYNVGEVVTLTAVVDSAYINNYVLYDWLVGEDNIRKTNPLTITVDDDVTVTAEFAYVVGGINHTSLCGEKWVILLQ